MAREQGVNSRAGKERDGLDRAHSSSVSKLNFCSTHCCHLLSDAGSGGLKKLSPFLGLCSSPLRTASEKGEIQMRAQEEQKQLPPLHHGVAFRSTRSSFLSSLPQTF